MSDSKKESRLWGREKKRFEKNKNLSLNIQDKKVSVKWFLLLSLIKDEKYFLEVFAIIARIYEDCALLAYFSEQYNIPVSKIVAPAPKLPANASVKDLLLQKRAVALSTAEPSKAQKKIYLKKEEERQEVKSISNEEMEYFGGFTDTACLESVENYQEALTLPYYFNRGGMSVNKSTSTWDGKEHRRYMRNCLTAFNTADSLVDYWLAGTIEYESPNEYELPKDYWRELHEKFNKLCHSLRMTMNPYLFSVFESHTDCRKPHIHILVGVSKERTRLRELDHSRPEAVMGYLRRFFEKQEGVSLAFIQEDKEKHYIYYMLKQFKMNLQTLSEKLLKKQERLNADEKKALQTWVMCREAKIKRLRYPTFKEEDKKLMEQENKKEDLDFCPLVDLPARFEQEVEELKEGVSTQNEITPMTEDEEYAFVQKTYMKYFKKCSSCMLAHSGKEPCLMGVWIETHVSKWKPGEKLLNFYEFCARYYRSMKNPTERDLKALEIVEKEIKRLEL